MPLKTYKLENHRFMNIFLRGGIIGGGKLKLSTAPGPGAPTGSNTKLAVLGLHTKTLVFTTPAVTVAFSDPSGNGLSPKEILSQINTALGVNYVARFMDDRLVIEDKDASGTLVLNCQTSTAARAFGFPTGTGVTVTGKVFNAPDGVAPRLVNFTPDSSMDGIIVLTEEA